MHVLKFLSDWLKRNNLATSICKGGWSFPLGYGSGWEWMSGMAERIVPPGDIHILIFAIREYTILHGKGAFKVVKAIKVNCLILRWDYHHLITRSLRPKVIAKILKCGRSGNPQNQSDVTWRDVRPTLPTISGLEDRGRGHEANNSGDF